MSQAEQQTFSCIKNNKNEVSYQYFNANVELVTDTTIYKQQSYYIFKLNFRRKIVRG